MDHYANSENYNLTENQRIGSDRKHILILADEHQLFHSSLTVLWLFPKLYGYQLTSHNQSYSLVIHSEQGCQLPQLRAPTQTPPYAI